jgi:hypothetical protein
MKKYKINAVHEDDLDTFFDGLGLLNDLNNNKIKCSTCNCTVTKENFGCIYPYKNDIKLCCDKLDCYSKILRKMEESI